MTSALEGTIAPTAGGGRRLLLNGRTAAGRVGHLGAPSVAEVRGGDRTSTDEQGGRGTRGVADRPRESVDQPQSGEEAGCGVAAGAGDCPNEPRTDAVHEGGEEGEVPVDAGGMSRGEGAAVEKRSDDNAANKRKRCTLCGRTERTACNWESQPPLSRVQLMTALLQKEVKAVCVAHGDDNSLSISHRHQRTRLSVAQAEEIITLLQGVIFLADEELGHAAHDLAAMNRAVAACKKVGERPARLRGPAAKQEAPVARLRKRRLSE